MGYQYTYLLKALLFFIIWIILFLWKKDNRKDMLKISIIFAFAGPLSEILYTQDWWSPETITNTGMGFESFFVAFFIAGIASVIYKNLFNKKTKFKENKKEKIRKRKKLFLLLITMLILFYGSFYLVKLNSLISTIIAFLIPTLIIYYNRKDLVKQSIVSGILLVVVAMIVYSFLEFLTPGWIHAFWHFKNIPEIIIFNLPIDDMAWYFFAGSFIGILYEFWKEGRLINLKK